MSDKPGYADLRREYGKLTLTKSQAASDPLQQFESWFEDILKTENPDPTAMLLSTIDAQGQPDSRVVLLKGISSEGFVFYTNYNSTKAQHIENNPKVCVNFFWPRLVRQVKIRGTVAKISAEQSDSYFHSRPFMSQIGAIASPQSEVLPDREALEARMNALIEKYGQEAIMRPEHWGGYRLTPTEYEFWQGRDNRLHDRLRYTPSDDGWLIERLAP